MNVMRKKRWLGVVGIITVWLACHFQGPMAMGAERVRLALPSRSMGYLPLFVALHRGFLRDEGLELETPMMVPNIAHNALLSGDVDFHGAARRHNQHH